MVMFLVGCATYLDHAADFEAAEGPFEECGTVVINTTWTDVETNEPQCEAREPEDFAAWTCFADAQLSCTPSRVTVSKDPAHALFVLDDCSIRVFREDMPVAGACDAESFQWFPDCEDLVVVDGACLYPDA